jgi:cell division protein FtsN
MISHQLDRLTRQRMNQQRGGTFLGIIIGVVVGLAAALGVAVYVTKVPIPFINKGQTRSAEQDVAESKKNKDWDPNAPLYGKNPAKPNLPASALSVPASAASSAVSGPAMTAPAGAAKPEPKTDAKPEAKPEAKPADAKAAASADPLGDLARAKSTATATATASTAEPFSYFVQVGAYRTPEDAESQRAKLSLGGFESKVTEREQSGRAVFRVRVGPFDKREDADKVKEKLDSAGMDTALVRVQR